MQRSGRKVTPDERAPLRSFPFIALFALDSLARSTLVTIVPLQAYALLGDPQRYVFLYFLIGTAALVASMFVPWLLRRLHHRRTMVLGAFCMIGSAFLLSGQTLHWFIPGLALQLFAGATIMISLNLYVLRNIPRDEITRFEPLRILFAGGAWVIGPALGVFLEESVVVWLPYLAAGLFSLIQICLFLTLRMEDPGQGTGALTGRSNPVRFIPRYFAQPRLVLAWLLSVTRAGWWGLFYQIAPVYLLTIGFEKQTIGIIISIGSAGMLTVLFWGWVARRVGLRALLTKAFALAGLLTILVATTTGYPLLAALFLVVAAAATAIIDSSGNVPYLRAVRPHERSEMTAVYGTYRDISRVASQGLFSLLLTVLPFTAIFIVGGGVMVILSRCAGKLPRNLGIAREDRSDKSQP